MAILTAGLAWRSSASSGIDPQAEPYSTAVAVDVNPAPDVFETTIVAKTVTRDIGGGVLANMWTYNGTVPGPRIDVEVGHTVIVHFRNELPLPSSIHWHGIELSNASDGTTLTQNGVPTGGSFIYRFTVPRPGIFWYHPHHSPTNAVFKGQYGSLVVADPHEDTLVAKGVLPPSEQTKTLVLSDVTVCKHPGTNDTDTYDDSLPWAGGGPLPEQRPPYPSDLCDRPRDERGEPIVDADGQPIPLQKGDIPNIQRFQIAAQGRTNEGQTVLTNGRNAGARGGSPEAPGAVAPDASVVDLPAGQGMRIQAVNAATVRYFRLRMTDSAGNQLPLVRVGGEGGLLDHARVEGGRIGGDGMNMLSPFNTKYESGELVLAPSDRSDFVIAVPSDAPQGVATLWTLDYLRTGEDFPYTPTVPVMHIDIKAPTSESYSLPVGTPLRADPDVADPVEALGPPRGGLFPDTTGISPLLDPATFNPPKPGTANEEIRLTTNAIGHGPGIDNIEGIHDADGVDYTARPHTATTRYARVGDLLELTVKNETAAHHAFHLHGFSFQPLAYEKFLSPTYTFDYNEFVDTIDIPRDYTLRFRVRLDDRPLMDGTTPGGAHGRWVFHCHIFFHAAHGMHAELVVVPPDGNEKPFVDPDTSTVVVTEGAAPAMTGTYSDPDGDSVTLAASVGTVTDAGGGRWSWEGAGLPAGRHRVFVTATDDNGLRNQRTFDAVVENAAPTVAVVSPASGASYLVGSTVAVTAAVSDAGGQGGLACRFDWDNGLGSGPPVAVVGGTCTESRTIGAAGVYTVRVSASDAAGAVASDSTRIVVYDPAAGSVTGSGTIEPLPGSTANFDVVVKYQKGSTTPTGDLAFDDPAASFAFEATGFAWLVVDGKTAQAGGTGRVGTAGGHSFLVTVVDGAPDRFRLQVRDPAGVVVYDNVPGAADDMDEAAPQPIASGNVVVHH